MCTNIEDRLTVKSCAFVNDRFQECGFLFWHLSREFSHIICAPVPGPTLSGVHLRPGCGVVPKSYQRWREGQPRNTENELTNDRWRWFKTKPKPEKETKERNLEKVKEENLPDSNYKIPKTHRSACDHPANCARWQFVANFIIPLPFIAQHVIDKKLVSSLTQLSFLLVRFKLYRDVVRPIQKPLASVVHFARTKKLRNKGWTAQSRPPRKKKPSPF